MDLLLNQLSLIHGLAAAESVITVHGLAGSRPNLMGKGASCGFNFNVYISV